MLGAQLRAWVRAAEGVTRCSTSRERTSAGERAEPAELGAEPASLASPSAAAAAGQLLTSAAPWASQRRGPCCRPTPGRWTRERGGRSSCQISGVTGERCGRDGGWSGLGEGRQRILPELAIKWSSQRGEICGRRRWECLARGAGQRKVSLRRQRTLHHKRYKETSHVFKLCARRCGAGATSA